jgi:rhamnosyltransferase
MEDIRIAGVVVLYYPNFDDLNQNINSYIDYVDLLIVVANSEIDESLLVKTNKIEIIKNKTNLGIAKALNQAAEFSRNRAFNWLLTMDQDSRFLNDMFFKAFQQANKKNVAIFTPNHQIVNEIENCETVFFEESEKDVLVMTSGNIISLDIYKEIGGFEDKLFIDEVDIDYCLKAKKSKFRIVKYPNIFMNHKLGEEKIVTLFNRKYHIFQHSPIRTYYIFRNNLYIFKKFLPYFPFVILMRIKELIKEALRICFFQTCKIQHLKNILKGFFDFFRNRYGSIVN